MKVETNRQMRGQWHVRVWRGEDERQGTTWPLPAGNFWSTLREKLTNGTYHPEAVKLTHDDFIALRSIVHAYGQAIDQPRWLLDELVEALSDLEKTEDPF